MTEKKQGAAPPAPSAKDQVAMIPMAVLARNPRNPRKHFDKVKLAELTESVRRQGVLQPILVRPKADGYELVAGERRWKAAQAAGLKEIRAVVREMDDDTAFEASVVENSHREDVNPVDEAAAFAAYLKGSKEKDPVSTLAAKVGHPPAYIKRRLALNGLIGPAREALADGRMPLGSGLQMARLPEPVQKKLLPALRREEYSFRALGWELERIVCDLGDAPFDKSECAKCASNGGNEQDLFGQAENLQGSCLRPECYNRKRAEHIRAVRAKLEAEGRELSPESAVSGTRHEQINGQYGSKVPRKKVQEKCLACDYFRTVVDAENGEVKELCLRPRCAAALAGGAKGSARDDDGSGYGRQNTGSLAQERREAAQGYATAWLAKVWAEEVMGDGGKTVQPGRYPQMLAWGLESAGHTYSYGGRYSGRGQLMEWLGMGEEYDIGVDARRPVNELLACLGAIGFYDHAKKPLTNPIVAAETRKRAAATFPVTELFLQAHLALNVQKIAKELGVKVPPQRGEAIKAILAAKLPAGSLTANLAKAFGVKAGKPKKQPAKKEARTNGKARKEAAG